MTQSHICNKSPLLKRGQLKRAPNKITLHCTISVSTTLCIYTELHILLFIFVIYHIVYYVAIRENSIKYTRIVSGK